MYVEVIDTFEGLEDVRDAWNGVYAADPEANFFLTHAWIADWLKFRTSAWLVLAVRLSPKSRDYAAFLPLRLRPRFDDKAGFINELKFAGAEFSDYAGLICRPDREREALAAMAAYIKKNINWASFKCSNLLMSGRRRGMFFKSFGSVKFDQVPIDYLQSRTSIDNGICPVADLPETWDLYLAQLSANNRQKIRRLLKKVDRGGQFRITVADGAEAEKGIDVLLGLWREKWSPVKGDRTDEIVDCNRHVLRRAAEAGNLFLPVFWDGDRPVAVLGTFVDRCKRSMHFSITGRDETFSDLPSGYLLHAFSIRHAIAEGFRTYDFLRGNEAYKYLFAAREERLAACELRTRDGRNLQATPDLTFLDDMLRTALDFETNRKVPQAEMAYRQIAEAAPDHALTLYRLGRLHARRGEHDLAIPWLRRSVAAEPAGGNAWKWLARSLQAQNQPAAALDAWRKVLDIEPRNDEAARAVAHLRLTAPRHPSPLPIGVMAPSALVPFP